MLQSQIVSTNESKTIAHVPFPGGYKHFGLIRDDASGRWYAVCTPDHPATHTANVASVNQRNTLSLYASADLESWSFVTDIIPATGTCTTLGFNEPSLAIDGNDLVIAFGVAAQDGDVGIRYTSESNFLCVRRVENFRSLPLHGKGRTTVYHVLNSAACVAKYWYCEETGEMLGDGIFVQNGTYGGQTLKNLNGLAVGATRVFVSGITAEVPYIWEFDKSGAFVRLWTLPGRVDELALSHDEKTLYATDAFVNNCLYRCDLASGTFTKIFSYADNGGAINTCRAVEPLSDGTILFANRADSKVQHIDAEGNFLETVVTLTGDVLPQVLLDSQWDWYSTSDPEYKDLFHNQYELARLNQESAAVYPELDSALKAWSGEKQARQEEYNSHMHELADDVYENEAQVLPLTAQSDLYVRRADEKVLSLLEFTASYEGGVHGMYGYFGYNFDSGGFFKRYLC